VKQILAIFSIAMSNLVFRNAKILKFFWPAYTKDGYVKGQCYDDYFRQKNCFFLEN
jgi:hypothetical protein